MYVHWVLITYHLCKSMIYAPLYAPHLCWPRVIGSLGGSGEGRKFLVSEDLLMWLKKTNRVLRLMSDIATSDYKIRYGSTCIYVGVLLCMNGGCVLTWKSIASKLRQVNQGIKKWRWCKFIHVLTLSILNQYKTISKLLNTTCSAYI